MALYEYRGPVLYYDKVIASNWKAETRAESKEKAVNNLKYQFKSYAHLVSGTGGIALPGTITVV